MDPVTALDRRMGASWWRALMTAGVTDGDLRGAVRRGRVLSLGGGTYALPGAAPDAVVAARLRGRLTCSSAAKRHGLDLLTDPLVPHVVVPRNHAVDTTDAVVHRAAVPGTGPVVPLLHALVAVLRCLDTVDAVVVVDSALRQGSVRRRSLDARLRGPGSVEARRRLGLADARSGSVIETVARLALRQAGLPVDCQVLIQGVGRVDLVVDGWLVVELDGFAYHSDRDRYRTDRRRTNGLVARGYRVLRFSYEDVMFHLADVVAQVVAVHAAGR
jgi:very-short-patch-repair endonuclease